MSDGRQSFETCFRESFPAVSAYARRRTDQVDAQDVVAETFLTAWRRWEERPSHDVLPWLYGIAWKALANQRRGRERQRALSDRLATQREDAGPAPHAPVSPELFAALQGLPEIERELLLLVAWEGLTPSEAGHAVGCRPGAARARLHRARTRLRRDLADLDTPEMPACSAATT